MFLHGPDDLFHVARPSSDVREKVSVCGITFIGDLGEGAHQQVGDRPCSDCTAGSGVLPATDGGTPGPAEPRPVLWDTPLGGDMNVVDDDPTWGLELEWAP
jgi:hypothetical protein